MKSIFRASLLRASVASVLAPGVLGGVKIHAGRKRAAEGTEDKEDGGEGNAENDELPEGWVTDTVIGPGAATVASVLLELVGTELVVDETAKSDGVTKELQRGNGVAEDEHGGDDEENVLQHTGEGKDEGRSPANL